MGNYRDIAISVLKSKKGQKLTPHEIWILANEMGLISKETITGKTPEATMASLLLRETNKGTYKNKETVFKYDVSPRRYWLKADD